jgi:hypothetical protein
MSGAHGQLLGHLVRRGATMAQVTFSQVTDAQAAAEKQQVHDDFFEFVRNQDDKSDPAGYIDIMDYLPAVAVALITAVLIAAVCIRIATQLLANMTNKIYRSATLLEKSSPPWP